LRLSLLHELAHVERFDHWFGMVASLAQSLWFFLPQVWWIRSQLSIDQEFLADRSAALRYGSSFEYASSLWMMAARSRLRGGDGRSCRPVPATVGISQSRCPGAAPVLLSSGSASAKVGISSPLFQRILMLLHCPFAIEARTPRLWSWSSKIALVASSLMA